MNNEMKVFLNDSLFKSEEHKDVIVDEIYKTFLNDSTDTIGIDHSDIEILLKNKKNLFIAQSESSLLSDAMNLAFKSKLFEEINLKQIENLLVKFHIKSDYPFVTIFNSIKELSEKIDKNSNIVFGVRCDSKVEKGDIKVTLMATF